MPAKPGKRSSLPRKALLLLVMGLLLLGSMPGASAAVFPQPFDCYTSMAQITARAQALAAASAGMASWLDIGSSFEARDIHVLRLGAQAADVPQFILVSGLDANDLTSAQTNLAFAEWLLSDAQPRPLLDLVQFHLLFIANPDGRAKVDSLLNAGDLPAWVGNTHTAVCTSGVRLERNFATNLFSPKLCGVDYGGPDWLSELETQIIDAYLRSLFGAPSSIGTYAAALPKSLLVQLSGTGPEWSIPYVKGVGQAPEPAPGMQSLAIKLATLVKSPKVPSLYAPVSWSDLQGRLTQAVYERYSLASLSLRMHNANPDPPAPLACGAFAPEGLGTSPVIKDYRDALYQAALAAVNPSGSAAGPEITAYQLTRLANKDLDLNAHANAYYPPLATTPISRIEYALADSSGKLLTPWQPLNRTSPADITSQQDAEISIARGAIPAGAQFIFLRALNTSDQAGITQILAIPAPPVPPAKPVHPIFLPLLSR